MTRYRIAVAATFAFFLATLVASWWAGGAAGPPQVYLLLVFLATILLGATVHMYSSEQAPRMVDFGATAALALAIGHRLPSGPVHPGAGWVVLVTTVGLVGGGLLATWSSQVGLLDVVARSLPRIVTVALLSAVLHGGSGGDAVLVTLDGQQPAVRAAMLFGIVHLALLLEAPMRAVLTDRGTETRAAILVAEVKESLLLGTVPAATAVLAAVTLPILGLPALPLVLLPLIFNQIAVRRHEDLRRDSQRSVLALAALPEAKGLVRPGHASRVCALATDIGRSLGLTRRELDELGRAAMLHDLGQVRLHVPVPSGATAVAAPADQVRIAVGGAAIARATGVLGAEANLMENQSFPYHQHVSHLRDIPVGSRIIKVANAYDDFLTGRVPGLTSGDREAALERIYLGLGHEYDPRVVDALVGLVGVSGPGAPSASAATS